MRETVIETPNVLPSAKDSDAPQVVRKEIAAPGQARKERIQMLDAVRLLAAVLVVWTHCAESDKSAPFRILGTYSVPFYTFVSLFFLSRRSWKNPDESLLHYAIARFNRLYVPFLVWTVIYTLLKVAKKAAGLQNHYPLDFGWSMLWDGTTPHLWFLPYLLCWSIISFIVFHFCVHSNTRRVLCATALLVAAGFLGATHSPRWFDHAYHDLLFSAQIWRVAPAALMALGLMLIWPRTTGVQPLSLLVGYGSIALLAVGIGFEFYLGHENLLLRAGCGLALFLLAFSPFKGKLIQLLGKYGRLSYGIYLSHHMFLAFAQTAVNKEFKHRGPLVDLAMLPIVFFTSLGFCIVMNRWKPTRFLIGGGSD